MIYQACVNEIKNNYIPNDCLKRDILKQVIHRAVLIMQGKTNANNFEYIPKHISDGLMIEVLEYKLQSLKETLEMLNEYNSKNINLKKEIGYKINILKEYLPKES